MEYEHVASGLKSLIERDPGALDAERLARVTARDVAAWFAPHDVPLAEERTARLQEVRWLCGVYAKYDSIVMSNALKLLAGRLCRAGWASAPRGI